MPSREFAAIARLAACFGRGGSAAAGVTVGIGDDAAVLHPSALAGRELVWTVDAQVEGVHFRRAWMTLEDLGWRSFVAAASDLAAMGADPWCALSALGLPEGLADDALDALARGQAEASRAVGCAVVGGNLSRAGELSVTTTLLGSASRPVLRGGAKPGDGVWLSGRVGLAALGLKALERARSGPEVDAAIDAFRRPRVNLAEGRVLAGRATAAIDVSDGLSQDAAHVAEASGVALTLDLAALEAGAEDDVRRAASALGEAWLDAALGGGEDYALLATSREPLPGFARVGEVEEGEGVWLRSASGRARAAAAGFDHFARPR